jgi:3-isopropylmalate/(R)-2-methylmalate dehydratase large subunit
MQSKSFALTPGKRVLFLTKDPELIRRQLRGELNLRMADLKVDDLLDDINTDAMTPGWVCFSHLPADIAKNAYAGLIVDGKRLFAERALMDGGFEVIVSGKRKGTGSSRETAVQAEKWSGIKLAVAASFAPIHARNNINQGVLMGDHAMLERLQQGGSVALDEFTRSYDPITKLVVEYGGLFRFYAALEKGEVKLPPRDTAERPMTMSEKILASKLLPGQGAPFVKPGDAVMVRVDAGYSHEYTTAQVHAFLEEEYGADYRIASDPSKFAVFEDHLIYADGVEAMKPFADKIETLRVLQRAFQKHTGVRDYSAVGGESPGICHQVAREQFILPGDFVQATDSHTCMGGGSNALAFGVGATEYAALIKAGFTCSTVAESIRFELQGKLRPGVTAKDVMLHILLHHARPQLTLDRCMEFGGPGLATLSMDERATLANMATECTAKTGVCEADDLTVEWIAQRRTDLRPEEIRRRFVKADPGAVYGGGVHVIDLEKIEPMVATPGDPDHGIPSDPTNGALISEIGDVKIDIAYAGSCTAGKEDDLDMYAAVLKEAADAGLRIAPGVEFFIQFGSKDVDAYARRRGYHDVFARVGAKVISAGCGACIGCGPGVSTNKDQVTVSAINRNFRGRSGPGKLWLASPLTVAASAITGKITAYEKGMFARVNVEV